MDRSTKQVPEPRFQGQTLLEQAAVSREVAHMFETGSDHRRFESLGSSVRCLPKLFIEGCPAEISTRCRLEQVRSRQDQTPIPWPLVAVIILQLIKKGNLVWSFLPSLLHPHHTLKTKRWVCSTRENSAELSHQQLDKVAAQVGVSAAEGSVGGCLDIARPRALPVETLRSVPQQASEVPGLDGGEEKGQMEQRQVGQEIRGT